MSGGSGPRPTFWRFVTLEALAIVVAMGVVALAPMRGVDEWLFSRSLVALGSRKPPEKVALLVVSTSDFREADCGTSLIDVMTRGGARAGLLWDPVAQFCEAALTGEGADSELAPPLIRLDPNSLRQVDETVVGFEAGLVDPVLVALGVGEARWVAPRAAASVPLIRLADAARGELDPKLLADRVVVVVLEGDGRALSGAQAAGALSAAMEDPVRRSAPGWLVALVALVGNLVVVILLRRSERRRHALLALLFGASLLLPLSLLGLLGFGRLVPIADLVFSFLAGYAVMHLPREAALFRADRDAKRLLREAQELVHSQAPRALSDDEFWTRLARRIAASHPADDVLVAELPPFSWRLRFWPNGELNESVIRERRRDIRRSPYANEHGAPVVSVVDDYLVMKDVPALLAPLSVNAEVEGYVLLIGRAAADHHASAPQDLERICSEVGELVRHRRVARQKIEDWRGPGGILNTVLPERSAGMLDGARAAVEQLGLLSAVVRHAPIGLFYVDSFGDVRILANRVARWLPHFGIELPKADRRGALAPGTLPFKRLLDAFAREARRAPPSAAELAQDDFRFSIPLPVSDSGGARALRLSLQRLDRTGDVADAGFVGALVEVEASTDSALPRVSRLPERGDPLMVFSLSQMLSRLIGSLGTRDAGSVKLQAPREPGNVVGHKKELTHAFEAFLLEVGRQAKQGEGPVLSLRETRFRVEVTLMDLRLGAPVSALRRALIAPSEPPPGLDELGALARAVENSHGFVRMEGDSGWGVVLKLSLVRARPRVEADPAGPLLDLKRHNKAFKV